MRQSGLTFLTGLACKARPAAATLFLIALAILVGLPGLVYAQDRTGHIYGRVADTSGGIIAGATVTLTDTLTGLTRIVITNDDGNYSAPKLQTGTYTVDAELIGFKKFQRTGLVLGAGTVNEINVILEVGETTETVEVTATPPMVNTTSGAVRTSIDSVLIDRIPLSSRNANDLIVLIPGMSPGIKRTQYSANGARETSNNFTLDGTDNSDVWSSIASRNPPPDALKEFTVQTNYSAEYGRGGGGAVIALTKSGTNNVHGSVYDYFRAENLNANSFQRNATGLKRTDFKQHQWGFTLGGPVLVPKVYDGRNKTFAFFSLQWLSTPSSPYLYTRGGLTAAELAGDFSQSKVLPKVSVTAAAQANSPFAGRAGQTITDLRPYLSPTALRWYKLFNLPLVQNSGDFFFESKTQSLSQPEYTARVDHSLSQKHNLSFSMYYRTDSPEFRHVNGGPEGFLTGSKISGHHYTVADVWTISRTFVNEIMLGYNRIYDNRVPEFGDVEFSALGLPYPTMSKRQFVAIKPNLAPSAFNIQPSSGKFEARDVYDFRDTISVFTGRHLLKAGVTLQMHNITAENLANIEYDYNGQTLGNRAAEFLIGWPASMCCIKEPSYKAARRNISHAFFQDDWKVSPRLSLNMGLRYEPQRWGYLKQDNSLLFVPGAQSRYSNFPLGVITVTDSASPGRSGRKNDWNNFAPRLGAAYRLDSGGKSVLRGGWGMFYDTVPGVHEGTDLSADFPFIRSWNTTFNRQYPGPEGWLDIFKYDALPTPDFTKPIDIATAVFNPNTRPGRYQPHISMGYVHQFNLTFEQEFRPGWTYSAAYIGSRGVDLWGLDYWNLAVRRDANDSFGQENLASRRPNQEYRLVQKEFVAPNGKSDYRAAEFTLKANTRFFHLLSHYTYSRAFANIDGVHSEADAAGYGRSNPLDLDADWSRMASDVPHRLLVVPSWDLPLFRGRSDLVGKILGNWAMTTMVQVQSGRTVNVLAAQNNTFTCGGCRVRPDATGEPLIKEGWEKDPNLVYVNSAAFRQPANGTFGNLPRNALRWPYTKNVDMSLAKSFPAFREDVKFELLLNFFNLFNWVNFVAPDRVVPSDPITFSMKNRWTGGPRTFQLGARVNF